MELKISCQSFTTFPTFCITGDDNSDEFLFFSPDFKSFQMCIAAATFRNVRTRHACRNTSRENMTDPTTNHFACLIPGHLLC